ncbi:unnamed protein product, partial [Mesorhabditis spiculigera]
MTVEATESAVPHLVLTEDIKDLSRLLDETKEVRLEADKLLDPLPEMPMGGGLPLALHHDIYATIKHEIPSTADDDVKNIPTGVPEVESLLLIGKGPIHALVVHPDSGRKWNWKNIKTAMPVRSPLNVMSAKLDSTGAQRYGITNESIRTRNLVCTVCQMTFKWKNSLKCHKVRNGGMALTLVLLGDAFAENESSTVLDNDLRQLTYATAAKKRLIQMVEEGQLDGSGSAVSSAIHSQPLITTASPKKKNGKADQHPDITELGLKGWMNTNITDMDNCRNTNILGSMDDTNAMLSNPLFSDMKPDLNLLHHHQDIQFQYPNNLLSSSMSAHSPLNVQLPLNLMNINRINGLHSPQQLPSVHHLSSTSLANGVVLPMEYPSHDSIVSSVGHPQYIVTPPSDIMLSHSALAYPSQGGFPLQLMDNGCNPLPGCSEYAPNFDYGSGLMGGQYQLSDDQMSLAPQQQDSILNDETKCLPYDQW